MTLVHAVCGAKAVTDSTGLFLGYVRGADNSMPRPECEGDPPMGRDRHREANRSVARYRQSKASTGADGHVRGLWRCRSRRPSHCKRASASDSSGAFEITAAVDRAATIATSSLRRSRGRRIDIGDSAPAVEMLARQRSRSRAGGRSNGTAAPRRTRNGMGNRPRDHDDADGRFTLGDLPGGTHTLEARAVGFSPARQPVDIVRGRAVGARWSSRTSGSRSTRSECTRSASTPSQRTADFERRLRTGLGTSSTRRRSRSGGRRC